MTIAPARSSPRRSGRQRRGSSASSGDRPGVAQAGTARGRRGRARVTTPRCCAPPTAGSSRPPTSSSRAGTSAATGRPPRTSGTRRPRPTSPTSPRWAARPTALLVGLACPADTPDGAGWRASRPGVAEECAPLGAAVVGGDTSRRRPTARVVLSVTALGDLGGRAPVLRSGARPGDVVALRGRLGLVGVRAGRAAARVPVAGRGRGRAPACPTPPYAAGPGGRATPAPPRCATSATGCSPTSGTSPPQPGR